MPWSSLKQTGNSSQHSGDLMSSVQFIVDNFRKRLRQASCSVLTTALGSTDHSSLMMRTSFRGSLSNAGNMTLPSSTVVTLNRCWQRIVLGQFARAVRKWISQSDTWMETLELAYIYCCLKISILLNRLISRNDNVIQTWIYAWNDLY